MHRYLSRLLSSLLVIATCATGCDPGDPTDAASTPELAATALATASSALDSRGDEPTDTALATVRLSQTHVVTFTESSDGDLEVVERLNADLDQGHPSLAELDPQGSTLARLHRHLLPAAPVPTALLEADGRAAARLPRPEDPTPPDDAFSIADSQYPAQQVVDWDWNADANWFAQHFYTGGTAGFFAANATHISQTKKRWTSWYKSVAFNQSFEGSAWFRVKRSYSCPPGTCSSTKLSVPVPPRSIVMYIGVDVRWRQSWLDGNGVNPRVALAVRWVPAGTSQPPAPPASCGGHNQIVCFTGANRCKPGLQEYNGGCYGCGTSGQSCCKDWGPIPTPGGTQGFCAQGFCGYPGGSCQLW
jgi:hypothetical protein